MTQVNLLPGDVRERQRTKRVTGLVIAATAGVIGLLFFVFVLQAARLSKANDELAAQQATNSRLQSQVAQLQPYAQLQQIVLDRQILVAEQRAGTVLWSGVLRDVSMVIPGDMWLTAMTGSLTTTVPVAPVAAPTTPAPTGSPTPSPSESTTPGVATVPPVLAGPVLVGSVQFQGESFDYPTISEWLTRVEEVTGWVNSWVSTATKTSAEPGARSTVQFAASLDLSAEALEEQQGRRS